MINWIFQKTCCQKTQYIHWARITTFLEFNILSSFANLSLNAFHFFIHSSTDNCSTWFSKIVMIMQFKILWQKYNIWFAVCSVTWASHFCPCIFSCSCILVAFAWYLPQAMETTNSLNKFLVCRKTHWCVKTCGYWNLIGWMHCLEQQDENQFYPCIVTHHVYASYMHFVHKLTYVCIATQHKALCHYVNQPLAPGMIFHLSGWYFTINNNVLISLRMMLIKNTI